MSATLRPIRFPGIVLLLASACLGCAPGSEPADPSPPPSAVWFDDVAHEAGIDFVHVRAPEIRYWFPEIMSGGAGWLDYDADGYLDLYLVQGGTLDPGSPTRPGNRLYRNRGDGSFEDVTARAGVGDTGYGMGCAVGDFDNDGAPDLYVTNAGANVLYRNRGDGSFEDVTARAGVGDTAWGASALFLDFDADGALDLMVVNYVDWSPENEIACYAGGNQRDYCQPENYQAPATDVLYRNRGDGSFEDVTARTGLVGAKGNGLGIAAGDLDGDGRIDLYVANDGNPNQLWLNNGDPGSSPPDQGPGRARQALTFTDTAIRSGGAVNRQGMAEAGMGVVVTDIDDDGDLDLFMTHLRGESNTLYRNRDGLFEDATLAARLSAPSIPYTGFGVGPADFDHDGLLDLYVAHGRVGRTLDPLGDDPYGEPNQLYRGIENGRFEPADPQDGTANPFIGTSRAAAFADYDNDGDIDVAIVNNGGPVQLLRNRAGDRGHSVQFRVLDRSGRDAIGARVRVTAGGRIWWRPVQIGYGYLSSHDPRVHVGLGAADRMDEVTVIWPGATEESFGPFPADTVHVLRKGLGSDVNGPGSRDP